MNEILKIQTTAIRCSRFAHK